MAFAPTNQLLSHTLVALIAAGAGWAFCTMTRPDAAPPGLARDAGPKGAATARGETRLGISGEPAASRGGGTGPVQQKSPAVRALTLLPDGSLVVPPDLLERIELDLNGGEGGLDREELKRLGFSEGECDALISLGEELMAACRARELATATVIAEKGSQVMVKIPAVSGDPEAVVAELRRKFEAIAGGKYALAGHELENIADSLVREYGGCYTVIARKERTGDGNFKYGKYRIKVGTEGDINLETSWDELQGRASGGFSSANLEKPSDGYEAIFPK